MIFDEGGFVRTLWYGRSRIWQKTRKYRGFGGLKRNHLWLKDGAFAEYLIKSNLSEYDMAKLVCHAPISLAKRANIRVIEKKYIVTNKP